jgi:hypothetical protein
MKKRHFERIGVSVPVCYFYNNALYTGTVTNLSKSGMYIETEICLPFKSIFEIFLSSRLKVEFLIPSHNENFTVPVKVRRLVKTDVCYNAMGVELSNPPEEYSTFLGSFRDAQ